MDSSQSNTPLPPEVVPEELERLRRTRVSMHKACELIGRSYPAIRRLVESRYLITMPVGRVKMVSLYEIRRFLQSGNATEKDWKDHEEGTST